MKRTFIYNATHQRFYNTVLVTFLGSIFSFPLGNSTIHVINNVDDGVGELTTELYIIRIFVITVLVLMGGFFAGLCICVC